MLFKIRYNQIKYSIKYIIKYSIKVKYMLFVIRYSVYVCLCLCARMIMWNQCFHVCVCMSDRGFTQKRGKKRKRGGGREERTWTYWGHKQSLNSFLILAPEGDGACVHCGLSGGCSTKTHKNAKFLNLQKGRDFPENQKKKIKGFLVALHYQ